MQLDEVESFSLDFNYVYYVAESCKHNVVSTRKSLWWLIASAPRNLEPNWQVLRCANI